MSPTVDPASMPTLLPVMAEAVPTWRAAYSNRTAALMATMSQLAYDARVSDAAPGSPSPEDRLRATLRTGDFDLAAVFGGTRGLGFLAVSPGQLAVLAFRGTADLADRWTDIEARRVPLPGVDRVWVHEGFLRDFKICRGEAAAAIDTHVPPSLGLYVTGHSLGGALAQIASAAFERDNLAACYTFGSPRVGTANFDRQVKCPHYRVVNDWDLVPGLPFPSPWGYQHSGDPRLLKPGLGQPLRRDRLTLARLAVDLAAGATWLATRRLPVLEQHGIDNYRRQLEAIASPPT